MNETLKNILSRRSIRKFRPEQIKDEELQAILDAGKFAPSAQNQQSWHFTVIQNQEMLQKINETCKTILLEIHNKAFEERMKGIDIKTFNVMHHAPTMIIVSGLEKAIAPQIDGCLALENMFIAAESLGIGSCCIYALNLLFAAKEGKDFLTNEGIVPNDHILVATGVFGYKAVEPLSPLLRRDSTVTFIR